MNWKNARKDGLPNDNQEVLISVNGINYVAIYNTKENSFKIKHKEGIFAISENDIYWAEISVPVNGIEKAFKEQLY